MTKKRRKINLDGNFMERFFNNLCHRYLDIPKAATWTEWREWETAQRAKHPVLYVLLKDIPSWFSYKMYWITNTYYGLKSKYIKKQHYIRIDVERFVTSGLEAYHWYDTDTRILYGCFQTLVEFIEDEKAGETIDWNSDPTHAKVWAEAQELYKWWTKDRLNRDPGYPDEKEFGLEEGEFMDKDTPATRRYRKALDEVNLREKEFDTEDTEMLIRLITIRKWLWT